MRECAFGGSREPRLLIEFRKFGSRSHFWSPMSAERASEVLPNYGPVMLVADIKIQKLRVKPQIGQFELQKFLGFHCTWFILLVLMPWRQ